MAINAGLKPTIFSTSKPNLLWPLVCLTAITIASSKITHQAITTTTTTTGSQQQVGSPTGSTFLLGAHGLKLTSRLGTKDYYYTRTRSDPQHLRVSEEFKNKYTDEIKFESKINGTKYEYYRSRLPSIVSHDELVFETIDKMFRHRLSPFYLHHYDNEHDKRRSSDPNRVSHEACARDLLYLIDKIPIKRSHHQQQLPISATSSRDHQHIRPNDFSKQTLSYEEEQEQLTPELGAFFDSYARQEPGLLMGNTFWVGAYDQCVNRHIFELISARDEQHLTSATDPTDSVGARSMSNANIMSHGRDLKVVSFKGRYCVSSLKAPIWDQLIKQKKIDAKNYFKTDRQIKDYSNLFRLQVGICLPDSCDSTSLERHSDEIKLLTTSMLDVRYSDYDLIDLYCLPDETSPLREWSGSALSFALFVTIWLVCVFLATMADVFEFVDTTSVSSEAKSSSTKDDLGSAQDTNNMTEQVTKTKHELRPRPSVRRVRFYVCCFSLRANYNKLMRISSDASSDKTKKQSNTNGVLTKTTTDKQLTNSTTSPVTSAEESHIEIDLKFLNAFKAFIIFWIINGHIMLLMIQTAKNILYSDALLNGLMHFLIGATFGVDLFFTMTGFLTSYLIFNSGHAYKMRISTWIYLSFHRYWRLAPLYLLAFWFSRSVAQLLGSGPLWDYGTSALTFRGLCTSESWWYPLTLTSNLHGLFEECIITSWYISCDMQFWLVSPLFIHLLAKSPASGWLAAMATIIASSKVRYDSILIDESARYDELVKPRADIFMRVSHDMPALYTHPHYRISAYLVGLLAGHYVYMIKSRKWQSRLSFDLWHQHQQRKQVDGMMKSTTGVTSDGVVCDKKHSSEDESTILGHDKNKAGRFISEATSNNVATKQHECDQPLQASKKIAGKVRASRQLRNTIAFFGLGLFLTMSFASYLLSHSYPVSLLQYAKTVAACAYALGHFAMSIGASLVIMSMCFGQWPSLTKFLSHPNWTRLSKINYALLLLQCEAIYFQVFRYEQVPVAGTRELVNILFNLLLTLYPVAFAVTLVFEYPLANLEKLLIG